MEKRVALLALTFFSALLIFSFIAKAEDIPIIPSQLDPSSIQETKSNAEARWDYLKQEWKAVLLKNKLISIIDSFFKKISPVFTVLFNYPYDLLSPTLWIIIILWIFFFLSIAILLRDYSSFSATISYPIGIVFAIVLAHLKVLETLANSLIWITAGDKPWWLRLTLWILIFAAIIAIYYVERMYGKIISENRKKMKLMQEQMDIALGSKAGKELVKAVKKAADN